MALKTNVYISEVTNLTEARYYAGMEVSIIGFNATPNTSTLTTPLQFDAITSWISGINTAWQWHLPVSKELLAVLAECPSNLVELNHIPDLETIESINTPILIRTNSLLELKKITSDIAPSIQGVIWEGEAIDLPKNLSAPVFLQTSSDLKTKEFLVTYPNAGIALRGIPELRPGWNDFDQLAELLESLETE